MKALDKEIKQNLENDSGLDDDKLQDLKVVLAKFTNLELSEKSSEMIQDLWKLTNDCKDSKGSLSEEVFVQIKNCKQKLDVEMNVFESKVSAAHMIEEIGKIIEQQIIINSLKKEAKLKLL